MDTISGSTTLSTHSSETERRKRLRKGEQTWSWVSRYNELDDTSKGERGYARLGVVRGKIKSAGEVVTLDLHDCKLQGEIPLTMLAMVSLRVVILFRNELNGSIPDCIGDLPNLEHLDVSHNALTGFVPESIGKLTKLRQLHVEHNQLSGPLPAVFSSFPDLERLTANNNRFSGPLPDLTACPRLTELHLHDNYFEGPVPNTLPQCNKRLDSLLLGKNCLQGPVPECLMATTSPPCCSFTTTPRSGLALPCQPTPQRSSEEINRYYYGTGEDSSQHQPPEGYYDEEGRYIQGYYDEWGNYIQGYYDENSQWITTSYLAPEDAAYYAAAQEPAAGTA